MGVMTTRNEFAQRLDEAARHLLALAGESQDRGEELRLLGKRSGVEQSLGLWIQLTSGKMSGEPFDNALAAFRSALEANKAMPDLIPGETDGYGLVLSYLDESEFTL